MPMLKFRNHQQGLNHYHWRVLRTNYYGNKTSDKLIHEFACKKRRCISIIIVWVSNVVRKLRTFSHFWVYDRTNVLIFALHINPFHLMLQSVSFRVMKTSIIGKPCDIGFYWKDGGPRKIVPQGPEKPHLALPTPDKICAFKIS